MNIRKLKYCLLIFFFTNLFACTSNQTKEVKTTQTEITEPITELKEKEVVESKISKNELIIYQKSFLGLTPHTNIKDYEGKLEKGLLRTGEGDFDIFNIKDENENTVGYFVPFGENEDKVGSVTVTSELAQTEDGIKIGDTFETLLKKYPNLKVFGSEIEGYTQAIVENISFRLDENHYNHQLKISEIKKETKIIEITIQ